MRNLGQIEWKLVRAAAVCPPRVAMARSRNQSDSWVQALQRVLCLAGFLVLCWGAVQAENPCAGVKQRALVLGGGGIKGAFETGAVYHLVVHRGCDFAEFSGVSVGALNAAFLAQAQRATDPSESHENLTAESEALVSLWHSLRGSRDVARDRHLATLRFGLFGLDSLVDFRPLRRLEDKNISLDKLSNGRSLRVGVVSFHDGRYREIVASSFTKDAPLSFMHYLYASSTPPVFGKLPRIRESEMESEVQQFADGSLRHITPVDSYVVACQSFSPLTQAGVAGITDGHDGERCRRAHADVIPSHELIQQLFVIVTSPYSRDSDSRPIVDPKCCRPGTRQITDGRKILARTLALLDDEVYRRDLDYLLSANDALTWRWQAYQQLLLGVHPEDATAAKQAFRTAMNFAFESYNRDVQDPDAPTLPYEIGLVVPEREYADLKSLLAVLPPSVQEQLYCGCVAADQMMQTQFGLPSLVNKCQERFPRLTKTGRKSTAAQPNWDPGVCEGTSQPALHRASLATTGNRLDHADGLDLRSTGPQ